MNLSLFDLFNIGIGPSSSHTVGPMRAASRFAASLDAEKILEKTARVRIELFGSLGLTGKGHGSDKAVLMGLEGESPENIDPDSIPGRLKKIYDTHRLNLFKKQLIDFLPEHDLIFHRNKTLPLHSNGMKFQAFEAECDLILERTYYSVGGGFVVEENAETSSKNISRENNIPHPFDSATGLLEICRKNKIKIHELALKNEKENFSESEIRQKLSRIWQTMRECVSRGCKTDGILPGGLKVKRRAPELLKKISQGSPIPGDTLIAMDWLNLWALAVNEENAGGGRVVTAPTNGAAGIIPAVLHYIEKFHAPLDDDKLARFLLTAGTIGLLYKKNASISGAEVGCQGEVGVACSMAAAGLVAALNGTNEQIENAAEIGMEHNLGLTCDPIGGLVQIPCIERNAMGSVKAVNAARIALSGDGTHKVSLDKVIKTMMQTGLDMRTQYKETSQGGLATNVVEC